MIPLASHCINVPVLHAGYATDCMQRKLLIKMIICALKERFTTILIGFRHLMSIENSLLKSEVCQAPFHLGGGRFAHLTNYGY